MKSQKKLFSLHEDIHYLNCAYKAPLMKSAENACVQALIRERNPVDISAEDFFDETETVRTYFAQLINSKASNIAIIPSTSYGFSSVLNNTKGKEKGNAITIQDEFPSGYFSLKRWCVENTNDLIIVRPDDTKCVGKSWNENILQQITKKTSVVLMSSVHWMNGLKFDLEAIGKRCKQVGAKFIVDGTQSVGALPMDVHKYNIDALICASYKWLLGPYSIALAHISDSYQNGLPIEETWMNRVNSVEFSKLTNYEEEYKPHAGRYNVGETSNFVAMPILRESLKQIIKWDSSNIQEYCKGLIQPLLDYLKELDVQFENETYFSNHLFSLKLPGDIKAETLKNNLAQHKVYASTRGEHLRISVNVFNDEKDIKKLMDVIKLTVQNKG